MANLPENIKNMWLDAANEPRTLSEPTQSGSHMDSLIEKLETENEALFLVIEELVARLDLNEDVETLVGIKVPKRSTRKHMRQVAAAIANLRPEERKHHHDKAAAYFRRANPNFKADVFRKACGVSDGMEHSDYVKESSKITKKNCVDYLMDAKDMSREEAVEECRRKKLDEETILEKYNRVTSEIRHLINDKGYPQKRAVAAALSMKRRGELEEDVQTPERAREMSTLLRKLKRKADRDSQEAYEEGESGSAESAARAHVIAADSAYREMDAHARNVREKGDPTTLYGLGGKIVGKRKLLKRATTKTVTTPAKYSKFKKKK